MAQDLNNITLVGRTTADIELKTTTSGKNVANFTLASNGWGDSTNFIDCVAWSKTAEILAQYATKGRQLAITGRLETRSYEDKDGNKRKATEVVVNDVQLLGGKSEEDSNRPLKQSEVLDATRDNVVTDIDETEEVDLSEIPF